MRHLRTSMTLVVVTFSQPFCVSPLERRSIVCNDMAQQMGQMTCQDNWPAGTNDYNCYYSCGGQCLGQKLIQSISFQDKCNMNLNWLMVHVSNESTHIHMDHKTQSQNEFHMIETWDFPILRPALLRTPKDHLAHVRLGTDRCIPWDYCNASWMTCQAFMMILCSALPPFMKPH